jgi:hypothetical protein
MARPVSALLATDVRLDVASAEIDPSDPVELSAHRRVGDRDGQGHDHTAKLCHQIWRGSRQLGVPRALAISISAPLAP